MGDMVATDVTVTLDPREVDFMAMHTKVSFPSIAFGASSGKAYPTGGIPLPAIGAFGMKKEIRRIFISPRAADGLLWGYDKVNHKIIARQAGGAVTGTISANSAGTPGGNVAAPHANVSDGTVAANALSNLHVDVTAPAFSGDALATHSHTFSSGDVTDAVLAEYPNADMVAKVLDMMVIGS